MFQDRLVNDEDRDWFDDLCKKKMKTDFEANVEEIFHMEPILYGDFLSANVENKIYAEITDHSKVWKINTADPNYNSSHYKIDLDVGL